MSSSNQVCFQKQRLVLIGSSNFLKTLVGFWDKTQGVPSFHWFAGNKFQYEIDPRHKDDFTKFFKNPQAPKKKDADPDWSMQTGAEDIYFLEDVGFDTFARDQDEMLVMFYSNSCGACSRIKPFYEEVATLMVEERPELTLAAVDLSKACRFLVR